MGFLLLFLLTSLTFFEQNADPELKIIFLTSVSSGLFLISLRRTKNFIPSQFIIFYLLFWGAYIFATISSIHFYPSLLKSFETISYLFIILSIPFVIKILKAVNDLIFLILIIGFSSSLIGIFHYLFIQKPRIALTQPLGWHTTTAGLLILVIPIALVKFLEIRKGERKIRTFYFLINFFLISALLLTFSKGAYISLFLELALLFFLLKKIVLKIPIRALALLAAGSLLLIILTGTLYGGGRIIPGQATLLKFKTSLIQRSYTLERALTIIRTKPFFGWGPATFSDVFRKYQNKPWLYSSSAHNQYLEIAIEGGMLTFILFLLLLFIIIRAFWKQYKNKKSPSEAKMAIAIFSALSGFLIHNFLESNLIIPVLSLIFWIEAAIILSLGDSKPQAKGLFLKRTLAFLAIIVLFFSIFITWHYSQFKNLQKIIKQTDSSKESLILTTRKLENLYLKLPNENYLLWEAQAYSRLGNNHLAIEKLLEASKRNAYNPEILYRVAQLEYEKNNFSNASAYLQTIINFNPYTASKYHLFLAESNLQLNKRDEAKKVLEDALNLYFPKNEAYYAYKYIYDLSGDAKNLETIEKLLGEIK